MRMALGIFCLAHKMHCPPFFLLSSPILCPKGSPAHHSGATWLYHGNSLIINFHLSESKGSHHRKQCKHIPRSISARSPKVDYGDSLVLICLLDHQLLTPLSPSPTYFVWVSEFCHMKSQLWLLHHIRYSENAIRAYMNWLVEELPDSDC